MKSHQERGFSMLLMIGILILVAFLGNKALNKIHKYRVFKEASRITMQAKKLSCEFDGEQYKTYAEMMDETGTVPAGLQYAGDILRGMEDITYQFVENSSKHFTLRIGNLDNRSCTDLVTSKWFGNEDTPGFAAMRIENSRWFQIGDERGARAYCTNHHDGFITVKFFGCSEK